MAHLCNLKVKKIIKKIGIKTDYIIYISDVCKLSKATYIKQK